MSEFEKKLQRQPLRKIPAAWRETILAAAAEVRPAPRPSWFSALSSPLKGLLWPYPKAWGALGAVWIVVFALNFAARDTSQIVIVKSNPPTPEIQMALKEQKILLAELIGPRETPVADRPKLTPQPRTERRIEQAFV